MKYNTVVLLGPTAVGKTSLGVKIASHFGWDIISADSRQVYKGLDIGSGKDLKDYTVSEKKEDGSEIKREIPHHLIDVTDLSCEFNVFDFQSAFYEIFNDLTARKKMPFVVGGTGMYLDSVIRGYDFLPVPENKELRKSLEKKSLEELDNLLLSLKPNLHNKSDLLLRERVVRAIEIALYMKSEECKVLREKSEKRPDINAFVLGITLPRQKQWENIERRLLERIGDGMIDEVKNLHDRDGFSWERLEKLGLEYRYCSLYLEGKIPDLEQMIEELKHSIKQFAKRQETWFRGMERKGVKINWLPHEISMEASFQSAVKLIEENVLN